MIPVKSTTLAAVAYDAPGQILHLQFHAGATYRYCGVPLLIYRALMDAPSKGKQFHQTIRGRFPYTTVSQIHSDNRLNRARAYNESETKTQ
jgi:hypothetical protein